MSARRRREVLDSQRMQTLLENPLLLVLILATPVLVLVTPFRTGWLLALVVFAWADSSMPYADFARRPWVRFAALLLVAFHGAVRLRGRGRGVSPPATAIVLFAYCLVSLLWADPFDYPAGSTVFLGLLWAVLFGLVARLAPTSAQATSAADRIAYVVGALLVIGLLPFGRAESIVVEGTGRLRGFFNNPNGLGVTCAIIAPFVAVAATRARGAQRIWRFGALAALAGLAFFSGSRTGAGGLVAGVSVALFVRHPSRYLLGVAAIGMLAALATLARGDLDLEEGATGNLIRGQTISRLSGRLDRWKAGLDMWGESPVLGKGFMTSRKIQFVGLSDDATTVSAGADTSGQGVNFHSQWIESLVDLGLVGTTLLLSLGFGLVRRARRLARVVGDPGMAAFGAAYLGTLTAVALDAFFHNWILTPGSPFALLFWGLSALALRLDHLSRQSRPAPRPAAVAALEFAHR